MKKVITILAILIVLAPMFYIPKTQAETLGDLETKLKKQQEKLSDTNTKKAQTQAEINNVNKNISNIKNEINQTYKDIESLSEQTEKLTTEIANKEKEIKEIISFIQVSDGESAYLEYAFGAQDYTDFIYRVAVAEQLSNYNKNQIKEYNKKIEENKQKQKEIAEKRVTLGTQQEKLNTELEKLGEEMKSLQSTSVSQAEDVKSQKEIVESYRKMGCKSNEDISTCGQKLLPAGTTFYRPLVAGRISSEWGYRDYMGKSFHEGIDMAIGEGTAAYAIGNGKVMEIIRQNSCGGNMVIVHHNIGGRTYTSVYAHLLSISVAKYQNVTKDTVIGRTGGSSTRSYDQCSGGAHLHLTVAKGLYGVDYGFYAMNYTYSINPRTVINFPGLGASFSNRYASY